LSSQEDLVKKALDVIDGKKPNFASSSLASAVDQAVENTFITAAVKNIASILEGKDKPVILKKIGMALLTFSENRENLAMRLNFDTSSAQDAKHMEDVFRGLIAVASLHLEREDTALKFPQDIKTSVSGNKVEFSMSYPVDELIRIIDARKQGSLFIPLDGFFF
jgi:hypothetical protein